MNSEQKDKCIKTAEQLVRFLAEKRYNEIAASTSCIRMPSNAIREVINDYGRTIVYPPPSWRNKVDIVEIEGELPNRWSVIFPLWTLEEGESDLSADITCTDGREEFLEFELNDIHVL